MGGLTTVEEGEVIYINILGLKAPYILNFDFQISCTTDPPAIRLQDAHHTSNGVTAASPHSCAFCRTGECQSRPLARIGRLEAVESGANDTTLIN